MNELYKAKNKCSINYVKSTMAFEGLELSGDILEIYEKYLEGEYTEDKVLSEIERITQEELNELRRN